jgi:cytoskeletal protein RodZ
VTTTVVPAGTINKEIIMKKKKSWLDLQIILASLAVTVTVGLWNVFAMGNRQVANASGNPAQPPPSADPTNVYVYDPTSTSAATTSVASVDANGKVTLPKVHILLGGSLPVIRVAQAAPTAGSSDGGTVSRLSGGGATNLPPAPPPATSSGSSKP